MIMGPDYLCDACHDLLATTRELLTDNNTQVRNKIGRDFPLFFILLSAARGDAIKIDMFGGPQQQLTVTIGSF